MHAVGAYVLWGFLPVYWKAIQTVPALQILGHRIVWSFLLMSALILLRKEWPNLRAALSVPRTLAIYLLAAGLLAVNWLTYIWAVNAGRVVESSLGYFINPLVSVMLGVVFLRERLRLWQWLPIVLAAIGVLALTSSYRSSLWIALVLAFTFGLYGMVKKVAPLGSFYSFSLEISILFLPALGYLILADMQSIGAFWRSGLTTSLLLAGTGLVSSLPLLLFGSAARLIPLSALGILQYLAPTCQFLLGVFVYHEHFTPQRLSGFILIWAALLFYWLEGLMFRRQTRASQAA